MEGLGLAHMAGGVSWSGSCLAHATEVLAPSTSTTTSLLEKKLPGVAEQDQDHPCLVLLLLPPDPLIALSVLSSRAVFQIESGECAGFGRPQRNT